MPKTNKILILIFLCFFLFPLHTIFAIKSKVLSIKGDYDYPPFEYLNKKKLPAGFNVDIMRTLAKAMGMKIHIELGPWHNVRKELEQGKIDALMGMFKTKEREKTFDFSTPNFIATYAIFVLRGSRIKSLKDARNKRIIVENGDLGYDYLIENKITDKLILKNTIKDVIMALSSGQGDCALISRLQGMIIIKNEKIKNVIPEGPPVIQRQYCIAVKAGNTKLLAKMNEGLSIIKNSGQYDKIYDRWFGAYRNRELDYNKFLKYFVIIVLLLILVVFSALLWVWTLKKQVALKTRQLYKSRENIKITLNSIGDAVIATNISGEITRMNPTAAKLTGCKAEKAIGKPLNDIFNIVNAKTSQRVKNPVEKVIKTGKITGLANHTMLISKNGKRYQIADSAAPIKDAHGMIQGVVLVFRNITNKYHLQEKLRKSQEIFSAFMDSFPGEAFIKDDNFRFVFVNNYMKKHRGADKWMGKNLFQVLPRELAERITQDDKKAFQNDCYEVEEQKPDKNGIYRDYLTHRFTIVLPRGQRLVGGISLDISEYKKTEKALKQSEEKYRRLIETTSEGFVLINYEDKIIDVNKSLCNMLGYSKDEIIGKTPFDFVDDENYKIFVKQIAKVRTSQHRTYEISLKKKTGVNFPVFFNATTLINRDEKKLSAFAFVTDLTKQKKYEKQMQKMEQLIGIGTLAGGIAHDFNNIMTGLFGNISIAKSRLSKDQKSFKYLEKAEESMRRASNLTNQLITFAKGGAPVQRDVPIDKLIKEVVLFDLSGSNVKPVFRKPEDLWMAKADKAQMQQVFSNLTINADQAMPGGGHLYITLENIKVTSKLDLPLSHGRYIKIIIRDEGTGIDKKDLDHIFDPYFTTKKAGSGLGLSTVYSIIHRHKGFIKAEIGPGIGMVFTLYLPAAAAVKPFKKVEKDPNDGKKEKPHALGSYYQAKILVMDDEEMICEVVSEMLKRRGYLVETAADGGKAIEMYKQSMDDKNPFDVIIMDLTIPGGTGGKDAIKDILDVNPKAVAIVSSGYAEDPVMANYSEYGFKDIIAKPYTMDNLHKVLKKVLMKR